jgi:hypothetical protein
MIHIIDCGLLGYDTIIYHVIIQLKRTEIFIAVRTSVFDYHYSSTGFTL